MTTVLELIRYFGLVLGVTLLISFASITAPIRTRIARAVPFLGALLYCPMCAGFWVGFVFGLCDAFPFSPRRPELDPWLLAFTTACESGVMSMAFMFAATQLLLGGGNPAYDIEQGTNDEQEKESDNG